MVPRLAPSPPSRFQGASFDRRTGLPARAVTPAAAGFGREPGRAGFDGRPTPRPAALSAPSRRQGASFGRRAGRPAAGAAARGPVRAPRAARVPRGAVAVLGRPAAESGRAVRPTGLEGLTSPSVVRNAGRRPPGSGRPLRGPATLGAGLLRDPVPRRRSAGRANDAGRVASARSIRPTPPPPRARAGPAPIAVPLSPAFRNASISFSSRGLNIPDPSEVSRRGPIATRFSFWTG